MSLDCPECPDCGGYVVPYRTSLSTACRCPDNKPVEPGRHQIGSPPSQPFRQRLPLLSIRT